MATRRGAITSTINIGVLEDKATQIKKTIREDDDLVVLSLPVEKIELFDEERVNNIG